MGHRKHLWKTLAESATEVFSALTEHMMVQTSDSRASLDATFSQYVTCLAPIVGEVAAFELHLSWQAYLEAIGRRTRLLATLSGRPDIAAADAEAIRQLQREAEAALSALEDCDAVTRARINEAARTDGTIEQTR